MLPLHELQPVGGRLYAYVFQPHPFAVERSLLWSVTIDFRDVEYDGTNWPASLMFENVSLPVRRWPELSGLRLESIEEPASLSATFYFAGHHPGIAEPLSFSRSRGAEFDVIMRLRLDFEELDGTVQTDAVISGSARIPFDGIYIDRDNLFPKPSTSDEASSVLAPLIDVSDFHPPTWNAQSYVFVPRDDAA